MTVLLESLNLTAILKYLNFEISNGTLVKTSQLKLHLKSSLHFMWHCVVDKLMINILSFHFRVLQSYSSTS